jgi:hypothetical protein
MSILAVCADYGRIVRLEPSAVRIEGTTTLTPVPERWFRCRLFLEGTSDAVDPQQGHWSSDSHQQVLVPRYSQDGFRLRFRGDEYVEIRSHQLGHAVWRLLGEVQPLRRRRFVIGWFLTVGRVIEREFDDLFAQDPPDLYQPIIGGGDR